MGTYRIAVMQRTEKTSFLYVEASNRDEAEDKAFERRSEWEGLPPASTVSELFIEEVKEVK